MPRDFGPNGALVARFLARVARLTLAEYGEAVRTWRDELRRTAAWHAAEDAVGDAIARTGRHDEQWRLQDRLHRLFKKSAWHARPQANGEAAGTEAGAMYLASTAAFALLVADAIPVADLRTLYAPFAHAIPLESLAGPGGAGSRLTA